MRKLLLTALIASGLTLSGASIYAQSSKQEEEAPQKPQKEPPAVGATAPEDIPVQEVTGKVINFDDKLSTIAIQTADGKTMPLVAKYPDHLKDLKAGDMVTAKVANGALALSITKAAEPEDVSGPGEAGPAPVEKEAPATKQESAPKAQ